MSILTVFTGGATTEVLTQQPPAGANSILVNLAPNTAVDLGPFTITPPGGETLSQARQFGGNAGMVWDAKRMQAVAFGGGHSGTNYNGVLTLSAVDLIQREEYPPMPTNHVLQGSTAANQPDAVLANYDATIGCFLSGPANTGPYPRAAARHVGQQLLVVGDELLLLDHVEGNGANTQEGINQPPPPNSPFPDNRQNVYVFNSDAQVARYSFTAKAWSFENSNPTNTDNDGNGQFGAAVRDPVSGLVVWVTEKGFALYNPVSHIKQRFPWTVGKLKNEAGANVLFSNPGYTLSLVRDPMHDVFYALSLHDDVWRVNYDRANPAATTLTKLTVTGTSPYAANAHPPNSEHSHRFDTANGVIGVGPFAGVFYTFNPVTKAWSHVTIANYTGSQYGNSHMMEYLDGVNVYIFLTDGQYANAAMKYRWVAYRYA